MNHKKIIFDPILRCDSTVHYSLIPTAYNTFIGMGLYTDCMFNVLNKKGETIQKHFVYPYKDNEELKISNVARSFAYQGDIDVNEDKTKLVYGTLYAEIILFYKIEKNGIQLIKEVKNNYPRYKPEVEGGRVSAAMDSEDPMGFMDVIATNKYVYALYSGKTFKEHRLKCLEAETIHVYNWEGDLIKKYQLNIPVLCFCVDDRNHIIYAISNNPNPVIVQFEMNDN